MKTLSWRRLNTRGPKQYLAGHVGEKIVLSNSNESINRIECVSKWVQLHCLLCSWSDYSIHEKNGPWLLSVSVEMSNLTNWSVLGFPTPVLFSKFLTNHLHNFGEFSNITRSINSSWHILLPSKMLWFWHSMTWHTRHRILKSVASWEWFCLHCYWFTFSRYLVTANQVIELYLHILLSVSVDLQFPLRALP